MAEKKTGNTGGTMYKTILISFCIALLLSSAKPFSIPILPATDPYPREQLTIYEAAVLGTPIPADVLKAMAIWESGEGKHLYGPDGLDEGWMMLRRLYHDERVKLYGNFDPFNPSDATRIAALILTENYKIFDGNLLLAVAAYNQGPTGTKRNGPRIAYIREIERILGRSLQHGNI